MEMSVLDTKIPGLDLHPVDPDFTKVKNAHARLRTGIFRFLLAGAAKEGSRIVDLGAGACLFAKVARDKGHSVTAVDARTSRKPTEQELGSIRFVQSDVREFDINGFDVVLFLGLLYHLDADDQLQMLKKCARAGVPVILETQAYIDALVPAAQTQDWARKVVIRGGYEGIVFPEQDNPMASIGNRESFWPTESSLLRMMEDAGFETVSVVMPVFLSKYGARRYYLLNCRHFAADPEEVANFAFDSLLDPVTGQTAVRNALNARNMEDALRILTHLEQQFSDDPDNIRFVAQTYLALGDTERAVRVFRAQAGPQPSDVDTLLQQSDEYLRLAKPRKAAALLDKARAHEPENPSVLERLVKLHLKLKRLDEAERDARLLISIAPLLPLGHFYLASTLRRRNRNAEALEHARRAAELAPGRIRYSDYVAELSGGREGLPVKSG